jgi:hypothetical protein
MNTLKKWLSSQISDRTAIDKSAGRIDTGDEDAEPIKQFSKPNYSPRLAHQFITYALVLSSNN